MWCLFSAANYFGSNQKINTLLVEAIGARVSRKHNNIIWDRPNTQLILNIIRKLFFRNAGPITARKYCSRVGVPPRTNILLQITLPARAFFLNSFQTHLNTKFRQVTQKKTGRSPPTNIIFAHIHTCGVCEACRDGRDGRPASRFHPRTTCGRWRAQAAAIAVAGTAKGCWPATAAGPLRVAGTPCPVGYRACSTGRWIL